MNKAKIVYFSHGGGPLPILGDKSHLAMLDFMKKLPSMINKPDAIIVISAHWEEENPTLLGGGNPTMLYDYYGFPAEAYKVNYPTPGNPSLAKKVSNILENRSFTAAIDTERGFDHGLFIPLMMMYPDADIPSIQLSLIKGLDAAKHFKLGNALKDLLNENVLIIGSGFSFHNMGKFIWEGGKPSDSKNDAFQDWLIETCCSDMSKQDRENRLSNWGNAPNARYCHPREEHLLPLLVCSGISETAGEKIFDDYILGKRAVAFLWK